MKKLALLSFVLLCSACATKRYPIATQFSAAEAAAMDCEALNLELAKAEETRTRIADTGNTDWRSAAGFLGDFGIGNAMARSEAEQALQERITGIRTAKANKGCV
ncbi:MAG: hypothetical protein AAGA08_16845 [Pseudomonadota bacterium]